MTEVQVNSDEASGSYVRESDGSKFDAQAIPRSFVFGSFFIDRSEFSIAVHAIREVVNRPDSISSVPLAPSFLIGLFNLRGMIIPIVDLRKLLEFSDMPENISDFCDLEGAQKVAIIENGDRCVGILFDRAGEVLNVNKSECVNFRVNNGGIKDVVINGVLKLDDGKRIVQILDPYELLKLERVPQSDILFSASREMGNIGARRNCVSFQLGHTFCGIDLRYIREVMDMPPVEKSLLTHGCVIGTVNLRGDIVPVVDFRSFMGDEPAFAFDPKSLAKRKLLVMQTDGGLIGLMVFSIDSIISFFENDIMPFAKLALPRGNIVKGCLVSDEDQLIMLLDHDRLRSEPGLAEPASTCQGVYPDKEVVEDSGDPKKAQERKTFILFSVSNSFAMDTCHVSEVINKPENLLEPPYALDFVDGILNLRGELITLINLRSLYGMEPYDKVDEKVLIFLHQGQKYAVLVDSVDEIVMTTSDQIANDRKSGDTNSMLNVSEDVSGVLHLSREGSGHLSVMIMDTNALVARCVGLAN